MIDDDEFDDDEIVRAALAGIADIKAGRYVTISSKEDEKQLHERLMRTLEEGLKSGT